jgi:predicted ATPase
MLRREPEQCLAWARKEIAVCDEFSLPLLRPQGEFQAGWALSQLGDVEAGIMQMEQAVQGIRATGAEMGMPYLLGVLGETLAGTGRRDRAIATLEEATASAMQNGTHFLLSEVVRTKACVLAEAKDRDAKEVEALFRSALDIATRQNAPLPALRAATGLARFLIRQRRKGQARAVLAPHAQLIATLDDTPDGAAAARLIKSQ